MFVFCDPYPVCCMFCYISGCMLCWYLYLSHMKYTVCSMLYYITYIDKLIYYHTILHTTHEQHTTTNKQHTLQHNKQYVVFVWCVCLGVVCDVSIRGLTTMRINNCTQLHDMISSPLAIFALTEHKHGDWKPATPKLRLNK